MVASRQGTRAAKTAAGAFIGGAKGRLLPASIPLRHFGAAVVFHLLAWLALAVGAANGTDFGAGLGWPLAAALAHTLGAALTVAWLTRMVVAPATAAVRDERFT